MAWGSKRGVGDIVAKLVKNDTAFDTIFIMSVTAGPLANQPTHSPHALDALDT